MTHRGSVDFLTSEAATGWIFSPSVASKGDSVLVQAVLDGRIIGEAPADIHRHDLASAGFGDGRCGFNIAFYEHVDPLHLPFVSVRPHGSDLEIPRTTLSGFVDFFRAVHARHPAAGRHRSVFGGLWTDRTDALSLLEARVKIGLATANVKPQLSDLICSGASVIHGAIRDHSALGRIAVESAHFPSDDALGAPTDESSRRFIATLPELLFRGVPLRILTSIFEDVPLCYRVDIKKSLGAFGQPSTAENLPSPAECAAVVLSTGGNATSIELVRNSHTFPEFTADGRSRWLRRDAAAGIDIAIAHGACVDTIKLEAGDMIIIGPGSVFRVRASAETPAVVAFCAPKRATPLSLLTTNSTTFSVDHAQLESLAA